MARPRVFVSSTYYDLKHIRSSLENFIESLGYDAILSEKGDIAYTPEIALDESCYREVQNTDIYVLIIGGRYGSEASVGKKEEEKKKEFYDRYESITKKEYEAAAQKDIPIYILIEAPVYAEFRTFQRNKDNVSIDYAHVDSANIFHFIESILSRPRNNPVQPFDKYAEIESWLREQWAGFFRELLHRQSAGQQIASLSDKVAELSEINSTLKTYLEAVITKVAPTESKELIENEQLRLSSKQLEHLMRKIPLIDYLCDGFQIPLNTIIHTLKTTTRFSDFSNYIVSQVPEDRREYWYSLLLTHADMVNEARKLLDLPTYELPPDQKGAIKGTIKRKVP